MRWIAMIVFLILAIASFGMHHQKTSFAATFCHYDSGFAVFIYKGSVYVCKKGPFFGLSEMAEFRIGNSGFGLEPSEYRGRIDWRAIRLRLSFFPIGFGALASIVALMYAKRLKLAERDRKGLCLKCGYDLRAGHERCPECGTENAAYSRTAEEPT